MSKGGKLLLKLKKTIGNHFQNCVEIASILNQPLKRSYLYMVRYKAGLYNMNKMNRNALKYY